MKIFTIFAALIWTSFIITTLLINSCASSTVIDEVTELQNIFQFNKWMHKLDSDIKVHLRKDITSGVGNQLFTNTTIKKGESVIKLPLTHVLCDETLTNPSYDSVVDYHNIMKRHIRRPDDRIALAVMTERALRGQSRWEPWIKVLPEIGVGLYLPHLWPSSVRNLIVPTRVRAGVNSLNRQLRDHFKSELEVPLRLLREHVRVTLEKKGIRGVSAKQLEEDFSLKRFLWAHSVVSSRAWNLAGRKYLVPGADMFNHDYDVEDKQFDMKRDTHIKQGRSQKFTFFHLVHDEKKHGRNTPRKSPDGVVDLKESSRREPYVEVLSDRRNFDKNTELFESYGDSPDNIYFQYLGFVASDVEELILAATVAPTEDVPPHMDLQLFSKAWGPSQTRNRRDCLELELEPPLPLGQKTQAQKDKEKRQKEQAGFGSDENPYGKDGDTSDATPFQDPPKPMVAWARRMLNIGGMDGYDVKESKICVRFGEIHPLHWMFHYMTQLPPTIAAKNPCIEKTVDPLSSHTPDTRLYPAAKVMLRKIKKCLVKSYGGPIAHANNSLRAIAAMTNDIARRVLTQTFDVKDQNEVQHFEDTVIDDAIEVKIIKCRLAGVTDRKKCFEGFSHIVNSDLAPDENFGAAAIGSGAIGDKELGVSAFALDVAHLMRLRYSLQQRMILLEIQQRLEKKRVKAKDLLETILEEQGIVSGEEDPADGAAAEEQPKKNSKQKKAKKEAVDNIEDEDEDEVPAGDL